jgi:multidrug resistance protein MdtO
MVAFVAGWIATGSERLSYGGMQIAMAFFFCILVGYGPTIDLAEARDRVVGILLGNIIVSVVFATIWPVSAIAQARGALAMAVRKLLDIVLQGDPEAGRPPDRADAAIFAFDDALSRSWRLLSFDFFEPRAVRGIAGRRIDEDDADAVYALLAPTLILAGSGATLRSFGDAGVRLADEGAAYRSDLGLWLSEIAERLLTTGAADHPSDHPLVPPPSPATLITGLRELGAASDGGRFLAQADWYDELAERVRHLDEMARGGPMTAETRSAPGAGADS